MDVRWKRRKSLLIKRSGGTINNRTRHTIQDIKARCRWIKETFNIKHNPDNTTSYIPVCNRRSRGRSTHQNPPQILEQSFEEGMSLNTKN